MTPTNLSTILVLAAQRHSNRKRFGLRKMSPQAINADLIALRRQYLGTNFPVRALLFDGTHPNIKNVQKLADYLTDKSIDCFCNYCRQEMRIPEEDMYSPSALYDLFGHFILLALSIWLYTDELDDCMDELYRLALDHERDSFTLPSLLSENAPKSVFLQAVNWANHWHNPPHYFSEAILAAVCCLVGIFDV